MLIMSDGATQSHTGKEVWEIKWSLWTHDPPGKIAAPELFNKDVRHLSNVPTQIQNMQLHEKLHTLTLKDS